MLSCTIRLIWHCFLTPVHDNQYEQIIAPSTSGTDFFLTIPQNKFPSKLQSSILPIPPGLWTPREKLDITPRCTFPMVISFYLQCARKSFGKDPESGFFMQLFRVDKIYLSRNSVVFSDMFSLPTSQGMDQVNEMHDGVPVVVLYDDADDVEALISVLYSPGGLVLERHNPYTPLSVTPLLRMSNKYEIDRIRDIIIAHLESEWPQTLDEWDILQNEVNWYKDALSSASDSRVGKVRGRYLDDWFPEPASAVKVAMEFDIPSILPAAFYQLYLTNSQLDFEVCRVPLFHLNTGHVDLVSGARSARWSLLTADDTQRLDEGTRRITHYLSLIQDIILLHGQCPTSSACDGERHKRYTEFADHKLKDRVDILDVSRELQRESARWQVCEICLRDIQAGFKRMRQEFWDELPDLFGLGRTST